MTAEPIAPGSTVSLRAPVLPLGAGWEDDAGRVVCIETGRNSHVYVSRALVTGVEPPAPPKDSEVEEIVQAMRKADYMADDRSLDRAIHDYKLPAFLRAFLVCMELPATENLALREAGIIPKVFCTYQGRRWRLTMVSTHGDVGISKNFDEDYGYSERGLSIYDLSEFSQTPNYKAPETKPALEPIRTVAPAVSVNPQPRLGRRAQRRLRAKSR